MSKKGKIKVLGLFVVILVLSFGYVTYFVSKVLEEDYRVETERLNLDESDLLFNSLGIYLNQAKIQGQAEVSSIELQIDFMYGQDKERLIADLDSYNEPNNPIRVILSNVAKDLYFNGIKSDNTDGIIIKDNKVEEDNSGNCVSFGTSRTFTQEMLMHANPHLALEAFNRVARGDVDNYERGAIDNPIFFQFDSSPIGVDMQKDFDGIPQEHKDKLGIELISYDVNGLKELFNRTLSWEETFGSFEFVVPSYILTHKDLADRPYVDRGYRTDISKLSINVVFNFKTVIDNNASLRISLNRFEERREQIKNDYYMRQIVLLIIVGLLVIICYLSMHFTNKLVSDSE